MNAVTDNDVIDELDRLDRMNIDAARGIRDETELSREQYTAGENGMIVTVVLAEPGIVIVTDKRLDNIAWSGHEADLKIIDDLYNSGHLIRDA